MKIYGVIHFYYAHYEFREPLGYFKNFSDALSFAEKNKKEQNNEAEIIFNNKEKRFEYYKSNVEHIEIIEIEVK